MNYLGGYISLFSCCWQIHTQDWAIYKGKRFNGLAAPHGWGSLTIMVEGKEEQVTSYVDGSRQRESLCRETSIFKTIRSHENYSLLWEQHKKDLPPWFNYLPPTICGVPPTICGNYGSYNLRFGWGHTDKPYHRPLFFLGRCYYSHLADKKIRHRQV